MSLALLPGSYDPITLGHLDIVKRALALYDEVVVAVMNNAAKSYMFTISERAEMARLATADMPKVRVVADEGMLVDLFDRLGADVIVKGVRNEADLAYEQEMAAYNLSRNPRARTVFLEAEAPYADLSSTRVRDMLKEGEAPNGLLSAAVISYLDLKGILKPSGK
ncbi:MAG: pantetheine-phosphate adenylyltransferase [Ruminococcaceae bacterium]|nr:pantetheine-phosphate adenylyltransferase [Oscillospiraceae bacterium]